MSIEQENIVATMFKDFNISRDDSSEIILLESGFPRPKSGIVITFNPSELHLLEIIFSKLSNSKLKNSSLLIGKKHNTFKPVSIENILYFEADGNYIYAVTQDERIEIKYKLYEIVNQFQDGNFIRIGKSHVVNILKVQEIIPWFGSRLLLRISGTDNRIEVSRKYIKSFKEYLGM